MEISQVYYFLKEMGIKFQLSKHEWQLLLAGNTIALGANQSRQFQNV